MPLKNYEAAIALFFVLAAVTVNAAEPDATKLKVAGLNAAMTPTEVDAALQKNTSQRLLLMRSGEGLDREPRLDCYGSIGRVAAYKIDDDSLEITYLPMPDGKERVYRLSRRGSPDEADPETISALRQQFGKERFYKAATKDDPHTLYWGMAATPTADQSSAYVVATVSAAYRGTPINPSASLRWRSGFAVVLIDPGVLKTSEKFHEEQNASKIAECKAKEEKLREENRKSREEQKRF